MNARQPNPVVTFYRAIPQCRAPIRADTSVLGTLPARGFQHCEALRSASSFGWYVFPPIDFTLQWDGSQIIWTYRARRAGTRSPGAVPRLRQGVRSRGARAFARLLATLPDRAAGARHHPAVDRAHGRERRGLEHPGAPAGEPAAQPGFRFLRRDRRNRPLARPAVHQSSPDQDRRADPLQHRYAAAAGAAAASEHLRRGSVEPLRRGRWPRDFPEHAWAGYEEHIVKPMLEPTRAGAYGAQVRRRRRSGCPVHAE